MGCPIVTGAATTAIDPDRPAPSVPPAGLVLGDRYVLAAPLGRGGMASVYRAHDRRLARPVAVKILHQTGRAAAETALREDRVTARLTHPHIVGIFDSGTTPDGRPYLVMELIEGPPLSRLAPLPIARALAVADQIAAALAHAHRRGIVHCDLKPQNVLLDAANGAKLTDFGVAARDAAPVGAVVYGSAAYLAPERLRGVPTSPAVDIYALGALLYFPIAGQAPYPGDSGGELAARVLAGPPSPLGAVAPGVPAAVEAVLSDPAPRRTARLTVTGRLLRGDTGIAGVPMRTVWHFRSGDATCNSRSGTDEEGRATCTFSMSGATPGHEVVVDVSFEYEGRTYQTQLRFTPQ